MTVLYKIDITSGVPVYAQLVQNVRQAIATGQLKPGDQLPTVRDLAVQLRVNRNTIARVYTELEREGYVYQRQGLGTFVAENIIAKPSPDQLAEIETLADAFITKALLSGIHRSLLPGIIAQLVARYPETPESAPASQKEVK